MASGDDEDDLIPESGAVFTFGRSRFADNLSNKFWIKNDKVIQIVCGDEHSAVVTERGRLYTFGTNDWGQLGLGHTKTAFKPTLVKALKHEKVTLAACGRSHTLVSTDSGKLYSFGAGGDGQLGHGNTEDSPSPKEITGIGPLVCKVLSCGTYHSAALTDDGRLYMWGTSSEGQTGLEDEETLTPTKVDLHSRVVSVSCGYYHTALVTNDGKLYTCGESEHGKLGLFDAQLANTSRLQSVAPIAGDLFSTVACGARHTVALTKKGRVFCWGDGSLGQLGMGTKVQQSAAPKKLELFSETTVVAVACGDSHTALVTDSGKLYTFGDGRHGKLGQGDESFSNLFVPTQVRRLAGFRVTDVSCGGCHTLVAAMKIDSGQEDADEEDVLASSMRSTKSIAGANDTMKPGSHTFPLVSPRDKRRLKDGESLPSGARLNGSLSSSLTMSQLSKALPELPGHLDRRKLPKIPGLDLNDKPVSAGEKKKSGAMQDEVDGPKTDLNGLHTKAKMEDGFLNPLTVTNKRLVADISFSRAVKPEPRSNGWEGKASAGQSSPKVKDSTLPLDRRKARAQTESAIKSTASRSIGRENEDDEDVDEGNGVRSNGMDAVKKGRSVSLRAQGHGRHDDSDDDESSTGKEEVLSLTASHVRNQKPNTPPKTVTKTKHLNRRQRPGSKSGSDGQAEADENDSEEDDDKRRKPATKADNDKRRNPVSEEDDDNEDQSEEEIPLRKSLKRPTSANAKVSSLKNSGSHAVNVRDDKDRHEDHDEDDDAENDEESDEESTAPAQKGKPNRKVETARSAEKKAQTPRKHVERSDDEEEEDAVDRKQQRKPAAAAESRKKPLKQVKPTKSGRRDKDEEEDEEEDEDENNDKDEDEVKDLSNEDEPYEGRSDERSKPIAEKEEKIKRGGSRYAKTENGSAEEGDGEIERADELDDGGTESKRKKSKKKSALDDGDDKDAKPSDDLPDQTKKSAPSVDESKKSGLLGFFRRSNKPAASPTAPGDAGKKAASKGSDTKTSGVCVIL